MDRKAISAFLVGCEPDQFMVYRDEGELGSVVVGPDGKKYRFSVAELEAGDLELNPPKPKPVAPRSGSKPRRKPAAPPKAGTAKKKPISKAPAKK